MENIIQNTNPMSMQTADKVIDILEQTGLNWKVRKEDLVSTQGFETPSAGIFRSDTNQWLGTVSKKYTPYQKHELVTTIVEAGEHLGLSIAKGGLLGGGKRVYVQMELPSEHIGNSEIKRYVTALNSHNGFTSVAFGSTNTVVICDNTFHKVYGELQKFRHSTNAHDRIRTAILDLKLAANEDAKLMETFKFMSSIDLKDENIDTVMRKCFDLPLDYVAQSKSETKKHANILEAIQTEIKLEGNTAWGLFNGITRYTNHYASKKSKEEYVMGGMGYNTNMIAYDTIIDLLSKNTAEKSLVLA